MVQEVATLPYVLELKVIAQKEEVYKRLDNIIVYFYDSADNTNKKDLKQRLFSYREYTRPSHPAMMEPIANNIQGIAFADESGVPADSGWGDTRVKPIVDAIWDIKVHDEFIPFEKLLPTVEQRFKESGIDPEAPQWNIKTPSGQK